MDRPTERIAGVLRRPHAVAGAIRQHRASDPEGSGTFYDAVFITNGLPPPGPLLIHTLLVCR